MKKSLPSSIIQLIKEIQENVPKNSNQLAGIVQNHPVIRDEVLPFHTFNHSAKESYGRRELFKSDAFCMYLMSWCPGDFTAIHDHGTTQWGCVLALDDFTHRLYQLSQDNLELKDNRPFLKGQTAAVYNNVIHMMGNAGKNNALSIHIYGTSDPEKQVARDTRIFYPELGKMTYTQGAAYMLHPEGIPEQLHDFPGLDSAAREDYFNLTQFHKRGISTFKTLH